MKDNVLPITDWGRETKIRLMTLGKTQSWLIRQVSERSDCFFDSGWLQKMLTGKMESKPKRTLINAILEEEEKKNGI